MLLVSLLVKVMAAPPSICQIYVASLCVVLIMGVELIVDVFGVACKTMILKLIHTHIITKFQKVLGIIIMVFQRVHLKLTDILIMILLVILVAPKPVPAT
jgi:hypothetical protein